MSDFFAMGGYAAYVWPSYALFFIVLLIDAVAPLRQRNRILRELQRRVTRQRARKTS
ncbi:MAG TPA: heme exporter protein CcmD [Rudaea sp.]|nr:heme exporter protein CcmD [Rudaea sp.]